MPAEVPAASPRAGDGKAAASVQAETSSSASPAAAHREKVSEEFGSARGCSCGSTLCFAPEDSGSLFFVTAPERLERDPWLFTEEILMRKNDRNKGVTQMGRTANQAKWH